MGKHVAEYFLFPLARKVAGEGEHGGGGRRPVRVCGGVEDHYRGLPGGVAVRGRRGVR